MAFTFTEEPSTQDAGDLVIVRDRFGVDVMGLLGRSLVGEVSGDDTEESEKVEWSIDEIDEEDDEKDAEAEDDDTESERA